MTPDPGRRYTADELKPMAEEGWLFVDVTCVVDEEPRFVVIGQESEPWIDRRPPPQTR